MNFGELKALVSFYIHRTDLEAVYPQIFEQVRERIGKDARLMVMEVNETLALTDNRLTLDVDFLDLRAVIGTVAGGKRPLKYLTRGDFENYERANFNNQYGYTIEGRDLIVSGGDSVEITWFKRPSLLVLDGDTNDVLTNFPNLYLYCALMYANNAIQDTETEQVVTGHYVDELGRANESDDNARYSGDALQIVGSR